MPNTQLVASHKDRSLPWKLIPRTIFALIAAACAPTLIILTIGVVVIILSGPFNNTGLLQQGNWTSFLGITIVVLIITFLDVIVLGIPAFIGGWYVKAIRWRTSIVVAFLIGAVPTAIFLWPLKYPQLHSTSSRWDGEKMVHTMVDGIPTMTGWMDYIFAFTIMGLFSVSGGLAFWLIWTHHDQPDSSQQTE
jgi:hypothetical protein